MDDTECTSVGLDLLEPEVLIEQANELHIQTQTKLTEVQIETLSLMSDADRPNTSRVNL